ncbi:MAG TPA: hypothetical protein VGG28_29255 [Kofleriaceae bacterium]|jgi:hypothetical protein
MAIVVEFFLLTLVAPGVLAYVLRTTRARWLPSFALVTFAVYCFASVAPEPCSDATRLENFVREAYGAVMLGYSLLVIVATWGARRPPPPIPRAIAR